jgi:hypothetical protein
VKIKKLVCVFLSFVSDLSFTNLKIGAVKIGEWRTEVVVICDNEYRERTEEIVKQMCKNEFGLVSHAHPEQNGFIPEKRIDPERLEAVVHDEIPDELPGVGRGGNLHIHFYILELNGLNPKEIPRLQQCAQAIIFYDVDDGRFGALDFSRDTAKNVEEGEDPISKGIRFLLSFDWNNCVNFATYNTDSRQNETAKMYSDYIEREIAYSRPIYHGHNNRWGRTHGSSPGYLLESVAQSFNNAFHDKVGGWFTDYIRYVPYDAHGAVRLNDGGEEKKNSCSQHCAVA